MLGIFTAIFLNLFLLLGMGGLALAADSSHGAFVDHGVVSTDDDYNILGHEDIAQQLQDRWGARVDGAVDMASLLKQIASDPAMRHALYCLMKNELGARYGGANGMVNAADDLMVGSIETILTAGAAKFGGSAKFAAKLRGMANKIGKSRVGGVVDAPKTGVRVASSAGGEILPMSVYRPIQRGETIAGLSDELKGLTWQTGNEHAVETLANGQRAVVSGGPGGISFGEGQIKTMFGHTHPTAAPPSAADVTALQRLGQSQQTVLHGGQVTKVRPNH